MQRKLGSKRMDSIKLLLMILPFLVLVFVFSYLPLAGCDTHSTTTGPVFRWINASMWASSGLSVWSTPLPRRRKSFGY